MPRLRERGLAGNLPALERDAEKGVHGVADQRGVLGSRAAGAGQHRVRPRVDRGNRAGGVQVIREPLADRREYRVRRGHRRRPVGRKSPGKRGSPG